MILTVFTNNAHIRHRTVLETEMSYLHSLYNIAITWPKFLFILNCHVSMNLLTAVSFKICSQGSNFIYCAFINIVVELMFTHNLQVYLVQKHRK